MVRWVHLRGKEWGKWLQRQPSGWPTTSLMGRIKDEGSVGAAIKTHVAKVPATFMPPAILEFHQAWKRLPEYHRNVVAVIYRSTASRDEKADALGISKSRMYQLLGEAHAYIAARIGDGTDEDLPVSNLSMLAQKENARV